VERSGAANAAFDRIDLIHAAETALTGIAGDRRPSSAALGLKGSRLKCRCLWEFIGRSPGRGGLVCVTRFSLSDCEGWDSTPGWPAIMRSFQRRFYTGTDRLCDLALPRAEPGASALGVGLVLEAARGRIRRAQRVLRTRRTAAGGSVVRVASRDARTEAHEQLRSSSKARKGAHSGPAKTVNLLFWRVGLAKDKDGAAVLRRSS
jgi:hypothetical protein